jgi:hypothetical protein
MTGHSQSNSIGCFAKPMGREPNAATGRLATLRFVTPEAATA